MGAVVVDGSISAANWKKNKPKDYKGSGLEDALSAYEKLTSKKVTVPASLPALPKQSAKAFEDCVKELEIAVKDMKTAASHMKDLAKALEAVCTAGKNAAKELQKLADEKKEKDERKAYADASASASAIALKANESAAQIR